MAINDGFGGGAAAVAQVNTQSTGNGTTAPGVGGPWAAQYLALTPMTVAAVLALGPVADGSIVNTTNQRNPVAQTVLGVIPIEAVNQGSGGVSRYKAAAGKWYVLNTNIEMQA